MNGWKDGWMDGQKWGGHMSDLVDLILEDIMKKHGLWNGRALALDLDGWSFVCLYYLSLFHLLH